MGPRLLITGFEAFGGWSFNPTAELAPAVGAALAVPWTVLPVDLVEAPRILNELCSKHRPDWTLHLGLSGRAQTIELERAALNVADFRIPDAAGRQPRGDRLVSGAPDGLMTCADLYGLRDALPGAVISNTAGTYLCNALYFHGLLTSQGRALFVHVPPTPGMEAPSSTTEHASSGGVRVPLRDLERAITAIARYLRATPESAQ